MNRKKKKKDKNNQNHLLLLLLSYEDFAMQALKACFPIKNIDKYLQINVMKTKSKQE